MKNDLLWERLFSLAIVLTMITSSFAGLMIIGFSSSTQGLEQSQLPNGDLIIGSDYEIDELTISGSVHYMDGDLEIRKGGTLIVDNGGLSFTQDTGPDGVPGTSDDRVYSLTVEDGGKLIVRNSTITTHLNLIYDFPSLGFIAQNGAFIELNDSTLQFPGFIVVDNSTFTMRNSTIKGHDASDISNYCNSTCFPSEAFDDSAVLLLSSSDVHLYDSNIEDVFEGDVNYSGMYVHDYPFASDTRGRDLVNYTLSRNPQELGAGNDCTGESLVNLTMDDLLLFTVEPGKTLGIDKIDMAGLQFDAVNVTITLNVKYKTDPGYAGTGSFEWGYENGGMVATSITPSDTAEPYNTSINEEVVASASLPSMSEADLGMLNITFNNDDGSHNVYVNRVWVTIKLSINAYRNITVIGSSDITAANTYLGVDFSDDLDVHNRMVMMDSADAYFYGVYVDMDDTPSAPSAREPAFVCQNSTVISKPLKKAPSDDTGQPITNITSEDAAYYIIEDAETMAFDQFNTTGWVDDVASVSLYITYYTSLAYTGTDWVQFSINGGSLENSSIGIGTEATPVVQSYDLYSAGVTSLSDISDLNISLLNTGGANIYVEYLTIEIGFSPTIYMYRWADISALDSQMLPVSGAITNATVIPEGVPAYYYTPNGIQNTPPDSILDYLGKNTTSYKETGFDGTNHLPLLVETISEESMPNSMYVGSYDLNMTYTNGTGVGFYAVGNPEFEIYPAMGESDQRDSLVVQFTELILDKPDLVLSNVALEFEPIYDDDDVGVTITVENNGLTAATDFALFLTDFYNNVSVEVFNTTIDSLIGGGSIDIETTWSPGIAGTHILTATVDPDDIINEAREDNNEFSLQVNVLAQLPDLSITSGDISFDPQPAYTDSEVDISATIRNVQGKASAINVTVQFYAGNPDSGGSLIGTSNVNVPLGGSNSTEVTWVPSQIGTFPIYVVVNGDHTIEEYSYENNTASRNIIVELTVNPLDLVLEGDESLTMEGTTFNQVGNIIIRDNASLILDEATLKIVQETNNEFQMLLENNASLSLINSTLTSNANLRIYFFDESEMFIDPSQVGSMITLELHDNTSITITESTVGADIVAASDSNATVTAFNSTLTRSWSGFGGNSVAYLTGISAPALVAKESAIIVHYQWLNAMVLDGTGAPLEGAYVEVDFYYNGTYYTSGTSGDDGYVLFQCLCNRITSSGFQFFGTFRLNATYWYDGQRFDSDSYSPVSFEPYSTPVYRDDRAVTIKISDALPDLDPPFHVSDLTPARNEIVNLQANISNVGVVPAHYVLIRFQDDDTIIEDVTLERIDPDETINVYSNWTAAYPLGLHNISVTVDPYGVIPEPNETNNVNYTWVDVRGVPDLVITSDDITVEPSSPTVNSSTVVTVRVKNDGDVSATDVNVSLYEQPPVGPETLVGEEVISQIYANTTGLTTITWTPSMPGNYTLIVIVDEDDLIEESNDDNNRVEKAVHVKNYADLVPADVQFSPASQVEVGNMLEVEVDIRNEGESTASNVVVRFWIGIPSTGTMFDEVVVPQILSSETNAAVGVWQANTSDYQKMETRIIYIQVNPDQIVKETDYSNDNTSATINVIDYRPDFLFIGSIQVMKGGQVIGNASAGDAVNVVTTLKNDGLNSALGVDVWLYSMDNDSYITTIARFTTDIGADGTVNINQTWVINGTMGVNDIVAWANYDMAITERRYDNNWISVEFNITPPEPIININLGGITSYEPDTQVFVRGTVTNEISGQPLSGLTVTASLTTVSGVQIGDSTTTTTNSIGYYETPIYIPAGLETGDYLIKVQVDIGGTAYYANAGIYVEPIYEAGSIPWWVWLVIIIVVAGVIIGFSLYLYKYGLGKMVECGECGALIPENSKKCPKCGVEFETGTAKCSECGAWIPASATTCPECGARFIGETIGEEEDEYIKKMREQYESMLADQKELAKEDLGRKYSEAKFIAWWKKRPNYISFENWLTEEEERRKSGAFPCPVCGTLNPRDATICHKCGTIFETKIAEKEEPKRRPLRRIVRRSAGKAKSKDEAAEESVEEEISEEPKAAEESQNDESDKGDAGEDDTEEGT